MTEDGIELTPEEFTVSVTEKRSTGDYENIEPHASVSGTVPDGADCDDVRRELLALHRDLQQVVERAATNRNKVPEHEDWTDPDDD